MVHDCHFKYLPSCHMAEGVEYFFLILGAELGPKGKSDSGVDFDSNN